METIQNLQTELENAAKVKAVMIDIRQAMEIAGVESYNPCLGEYNHLLEELLSALPADLGVKITSYQTYTNFFFPASKTWLEVGYKLLDSCKESGFLIRKGAVDIFVPCPNGDRVTPLIKERVGYIINTFL